MGARADKAYEDIHREEWRRFMAAQRRRRPLYIRAWRVFIPLAIALWFLGGPIIYTLRRLF